MRIRETFVLTLYYSGDIPWLLWYCACYSSAAVLPLLDASNASSPLSRGWERGRGRGQTACRLEVFSVMMRFPLTLAERAR